MSKFVTIVRNSLIAAAVAASVPAFAETVPTAKVSYADLDLSNASGQRHLHNRLVGAARAVCEDNVQPGSMIQGARSACIKQAMARADTQFAALITGSQPHVAIADNEVGRISH